MRKENVIFIDIDGVLNNHNSMFIKSIDKCGANLSKDCTDLFRILLEKTNSKLVVSSSWRSAREERLFGFNNTRIISAFEDAGFHQLPDFVFAEGVTKHLNTGKRGDEIQEFLDRHRLDIGNYVIIDDDSDMLPHQYAHFVQTDRTEGLSIVNICHAGRILGSEISWNMG